MPASGKIRLDARLVSLGLLPTRSKARDAVLQGIVKVNGATATKPGQMVAADAVVELTEPPSPYVSRAALKLVHGLDHFGIDPAGLTCLDIGASTGGFTEVLLERGAAHVTAVDVGHGQLHDSLREDHRVTALEHLNIRDLTAGHLAAKPELIVCDVSFISLTKALPAALRLAAKDCQLVALIKPQFEVGRENLGKGGIVRDAAVRDQACAQVTEWLSRDAGWSVREVTQSPITGSDGNVEFLVAALKS